MTLSRRQALLAAGATGLVLAGFAPAVQAAEYATGDMVMGDASAPIEIIEYASMTCPHCASFHATTWPKLKQDWIETGKARFVFREFPLDRYALQGSILARCGGAKRYFAFVEVMFRQQQTWARASDPTAALRQIAALGGLGAEQFDACLADQSLIDMLLQTRLEGHQTFDISGTPTIIVNGEKYTGDLGYDALSAHLRGIGS